MSSSSYSYVLNNPVNLIDSDGKDGVVIIDEKNKTAIINADYYVQSKKEQFKIGNRTFNIKGKTEEQISKMDKKINNYLNKQGYTVSQGDYAGYKVRFNLGFISGGTKTEVESTTEKFSCKTIPISNSFSFVDKNTNPRFGERNKVETEDGYTYETTGGQTADSKQITMNTAQDGLMNRVHEIFHTFGLKDNFATGVKGGIMAYPPNKPSQQNIDDIINGNFLPKIKIEDSNE